MLRFLSKAAGAAGYVIQYGCLTHCVFEYVGDFVVCSGPSMEPTLSSNNILMTERISARMHNLKRGDVVIAKNPTNPNQHICKRIMGMPGDVVTIAPHPESILAEALWTDEKEAAFAAEDGPDYAKIRRPKIERIVVPRGHVWIEGDNSENSSDSRYYGPIPQGLVKSKAICRIWPLDRLSFLS
ncbi:IMMP1L family protein [Megaselia abdita]